MKNQYMFFSQHSFEKVDLSEYKKTVTPIPKTSIHIYEFECIETDTICDDASRAKKLDELTKQFNSAFPEAFQIISSESSQYFCREVYPLVVDFEIKLRYVLYLARALYENNNSPDLLTPQSFLYETKNGKQPIENADFGEIYQAVFTDKDIPNKIKELNKRRMTRGDWIKHIQSLDENTMWRNVMGAEDTYIESNFLEIIEFRNDVMHNHLITYEQHEKAKRVLRNAIQELERAVNEILLVNKSEYLNNVNIIDVISGFLSALGEASKIAKNSSLVEDFQTLVRFFGNSFQGINGDENQSTDLQAECEDS